MNTDDFNFVTGVDLTTLYTAGSNGTTTGNGEDVFNGKQEGLVNGTLRLGNPSIYGVEKFPDSSAPLAISLTATALQSFEGGAGDDRGVVAIETIVRKELTEFHFDEFDQLRVVYHVALVQEYHQGGYVYLTGEEDVLTGLRHRTISGGYNQDSTVHLSSTGNHVLDVVGVSRAVYVSVVTLLGLVLYVADSDRDTTGLLFRGAVDLVYRLKLSVASLRENRQDSGGESGFTMVYVSDSTYVYVRLTTNKMFLAHYYSSIPRKQTGSPGVCYFVVEKLYIS